MRSTDQMDDRGGVNMKRGWSSFGHVVRRALVGLLGDSDFLKMILCFVACFAWAMALTQWGPIVPTWIRIAFALPLFLFMAAGFFFAMRGFWRMRISVTSFGNVTSVSGSTAAVDGVVVFAFVASRESDRAL